MTASRAAGERTPALLSDTIYDNLTGTALNHPDAEALVSRHQGLRFSYGEFRQATDEVARGLMALGVQQGDRVGIWSPNRAEWVLVQYATAAIGAILVNINPAYRTAELEYALCQSGVSLLVSARTHGTSDYEALYGEVADRVPTRRVIWLDDLQRGPGDWPALLERAGDVSVDELRRRAAGLDADDPINIQYTSGTTGFPKGATLTHRNILNNGFFVGERCRYTPDDRVCIPVPFYHCFGMVLGNLACTTHGACMVIPSAGFGPTAVLEACEAERCTSLYGVPTMFIAVLGHEDFAAYDLSSLRTGIMAGSPCPVEVMKRVVSDMHMDEVTICYGMTETSPVSTQSTHDDSIESRVATVGRVHPHVEIQVIDPDSGECMPRGAPGELLTRGYSVMQGYWNDPERTAEVIDADGWMHTGDLAIMDADGYLNIVGRIKDLVIRGGENIYPREVEEFLFTHPNVADVSVIGVPDERYGEELMAWVKLRHETATTAEDIREFCRGRIAHYKIPRYVKFAQDFPMTVTGKIQKFSMREMAIEELGLH
ncbi:MAG: AMP-binding protein [Acidimicrobiia bacterium]|nr:AMP-binding protein [Acidimicrobiia bacterium]